MQVFITPSKFLWQYFPLRILRFSFNYWDGFFLKSLKSLPLNHADARGCFPILSLCLRVYSPLQIIFTLKFLSCSPCSYLAVNVFSIFKITWAWLLCLWIPTPLFLAVFLRALSQDNHLWLVGIWGFGVIFLVYCQLFLHLASYNFKLWWVNWYVFFWLFYIFRGNIKSYQEASDIIFKIILMVFVSVYPLSSYIIKS